MPPIPSAPIHYDQRTVLVAVEDDYMVAPMSGYVALRLWDVNVTWMEAEEKELPYVMPWMGNRPSILQSLRTKMTAKVALVGCVPGSVPALDPFLRAGGCTRTVIPATAAGTIAASAEPGDDADGVFTFDRTTAYDGVWDRTVTLTCTTGGGTGVAAFTVAAPAVEYLPARNETGQVMTTGTPFPLVGGAVITPTAIATPFSVGDTYTIALTAPGSLYRPSSDRTGHKSLVNHILLPDPTASAGDARLHAMFGARVQWKASAQVNDYPYIDVEITSMFTMPVLAAKATPDYSGLSDPLEVSTGNTPIARLLGHDVVLEAFSFDAGNTVELVERVGRKAIRINDRKSTASMKFEEPGLGDFPILQAAHARTSGPLVFQHGRDAGQVVRFTAPMAQLGKPTHSESKKDLMVEVPSRLLPQAGDDEWSIFIA